MYNHKEYQREYQKQYQRKMHRILLTFNPANDDDMLIWQMLEERGNRNKIPFIKAAIRKAMEAGE